jgi:lipopolysaccharide export LptBFGC system permease protein LptF
MIFGLSCAALMRTLLRLSLHIEILITGSIGLSLRNLESPLMIALLALSLLLAAYVHVVLFLILIMNVLNNYCMLLMILFGT